MKNEDQLSDLFSFFGEAFKNQGSKIARKISNTLLNAKNMPRATMSPKAPNNAKFLNTIIYDNTELMLLLDNLMYSLHWRPAGFGKLPGDLSQKICVTELIGPSGIFKNTETRIGLLLQSPDVHYPRHWHSAEELYLVIAGTATWSVENGVDTPRPPGNFIHHKSGQVHTMNTTTEPLLALWGWTGDIDGTSYSI
tara:strand:- start:196 stop:780 length:585 start_codon:yes stop_codon:yes gene_type:complete